MEEASENVTEETQSETKQDKIEFKKPILVGRVGKFPKKALNTTECRSTEQKSEQKSPSPEQNHSEKPSKSSLPPAVLMKEMLTPIPYKEPKWSGLCPEGSDYALEVLKSGMIMEKVVLSTKAYYVFGRLANCDIVLAHPTISRYHAVLQYKAFVEDGEPPSGWYLYDLGSTHGTYLNKERLKPEHYRRVRVGYQIRFGTSTRTYIMLGPDFDFEGQSELTVTEIKIRTAELKAERERLVREWLDKREMEKLEEEKKREEQGIDWGMGEDAEEEADLSENPFAATANEELYLQDPKKTLRGYFEREGLELAYVCEERGVGQFMCSVELPMDDARGRPLRAEVLHRGKKKEAVVACALEACRALDRAGLLRRATHESRRRKERDWGAEDYYDSDEDTFLDRTGSVERKRGMRMRRHAGGAAGAGASAGAGAGADRPLTHDDLLKQISEIEAKISAEERSLQRLRDAAGPSRGAGGAAGVGAGGAAGVGGEAGEADALDEYMSSLGRQGQTMAQKADISKAKMSIQKLKAELSRARRLAELARPAAAPPLRKRGDPASAAPAPAPGPAPALRVANSVVYGKRIKLKEDNEKRPKARQETKKQDEEFVEEMDSDEEEAPKRNKKEDVEDLRTEESEQKETVKSSTEDEGNTESIEKNEANTEVLEKKEGNTKISEKKEGNTKVLEKKEGNTKVLEKKEGNTKVLEKKEGNTKVLEKNEGNTQVVDKKEVKRVFGPMRPPDDYVIPDDYYNDTGRDLPEIGEEDI